MKKGGLVLVVLSFFILASLGFVSAYDIGNCHCGSGSGSSFGYTIGYGSGACTSLPSCYSGKVVTGCCYGSSGGGVWWSEYCTQGADCYVPPSYYYYYNDSDKDGYGNPAVSVYTTGAPTGYVAGNTDCNDNNANINPGKAEICNSVDDNCNGQINEGLICIGIASTYWTNLNGAEILSSADKGDRVLMRVPGINLANQNITYNISQFNSVTWWNPFSWFKQQTSTVEASLATATWIADTAGIFNFKASVDNIAQNSSGNLTVTDNGAAGNAEPVATISSQVQSSGFAINFTHTSSDADDFLRLTWDFGDGNTISFENYSKALTPTLGNVAHTYANGGKWYGVTLTVSEMIRGQSSADTRKIFVYKEGINVVPIVTSPLNGQAVGNVIFFNASQSYVANCSVVTYSCSDTSNQFLGGDLKCCYIHKQNQKTITGNYDIVLSWVVTTNGVTSFTRALNWSTDYDSDVVFTAPFQKGGSHVIAMDMIYKEK